MTQDTAGAETKPAPKAASRKERPRSKRYKAAAAAAGAQAAPLALAEALARALKGAKAKFDESLDVAVRLGIDPKKTDQAVRGTVLLPHGAGKKVRVLVLCKDDKQKEAQAAGADHVGGADLAAKIQGGFLEFDVVVSSPDMMRDISKLGPVLGPRGMMPNPKTGTLTPDIAKAVREFKQGRVEFRSDASGNVHAAVGKVSFGAPKLAENAQAFLETIQKSRPATAKGIFILSASVSTTMGPSAAVDVSPYR
jgi:large subunit ribosomal protein L1